MNKPELITLAMKLYDNGKGISYGKIADKFNADGLSTVTGKGKWEKKMVSRLIAGDTLKKAEVKVGLKSERETQLESENELLKEDVATLKRHLADSAGHVNGNLEVIYDQDKKIDSLESENIGLRSDRDEVLKTLNTVKHENDGLKKEIEYVRSLNDALESDKEKLLSERDRLLSEIIRSNDNVEIDRLESELNTVKHELERAKNVNNTIFSCHEEIRLLNNEIGLLKTQRDCFKTESERLNRQLVESESKYKSLYESEITRLGSELATANQTIQELKDRQEFIKIEHKNQKNFEGWTLNYRSDGRGINLVKRVNGKHVAVYVGKTFDPDVARERIGIKIGKISKSTADNDSSNSSCLSLF